MTGRYELAHELAASVAEVEQAFRRDLGDAVKSAMSNLIINGAAPTNSNPQNVEGFLTSLTIANDSFGGGRRALRQSARVEGVDGIHATMETEVMSVIGDETYVHAAGKYITGSGESGSELLRRRSGGCMASPRISRQSPA